MNVKEGLPIDGWPQILVAKIATQDGNPGRLFLRFPLCHAAE